MCRSKTFKDFLSKCLQMNPKDRPSVAELVRVCCNLYAPFLATVSFVGFTFNHFNAKDLTVVKHPFMRMACPLKNLTPLIELRLGNEEVSVKVDVSTLL